MNTDDLAISQTHIHALWQKLTVELADVFDAHGIYATVATEIARFTATTTVTGVAGPQGKYYDVWICDRNGRLKQTRWTSSKASFHPTLNAKKAIKLDKFTLGPSDLINSELWQLPRSHTLSVPLPMANSYQLTTKAGVICLIDPDSDCPLTLSNIESLATNITIFLDRAYLRQHVHRQDIEFAVVKDISLALTSSLSLQKIFQELTDPVRRTLNVESVSVGMIDPTSGDITFVTELMGPLFSDIPPVRLKQGEGIAGWVAESRQPVVINDTYSDERFFSQIDNRSGFQTKSMICIPLQIEERVIGIMQAINKNASDFQDNDLRLLQAIGGPLAAAIENASLHSDVIAEKRRIETIFTSMSEGMLTINNEGLITQYNEALLTLLKSKSITFSGQPVTSIIRLKNSDMGDFITDVLKGEAKSLQFAADLHQNTGSTVPVLISGAPILNEDDSVEEIIFVFSDLRQIREVERMRDDFFHGIIHELRTPLATILMYARLLREGKASNDQEKADRFLGVIERESDRLQKMVRQMLQLAKMESREFQRSPEPVDLNPIFEEMLPPLADRAVEKGLTFRRRVDADLPPIMGNQETFYLIFKNLIENAIKFTMSGTVRVDVRQVDEQLVIIVEDEGIGIPEAALPNLFGRFFRAQTAVERGIAGTGLGLYMVKEAVENYDGTITVQSAEDMGTTFRVTFPIVEI